MITRHLTLKKSIQFSMILVLLNFIACKKFVEISAPTTEVTSGTVFSNDQTATSAMIGLYSMVMQNSNTLFNGSLTIYPGLSADELVRNTSSTTDMSFQKNALASSNSTIVSLWSLGYKCIYQANAILEGLQKSTELTITTKNQLTGEAKFFRAFTYFYLYNLFGNVPLQLTTNYEVNSIMPRADSTTIYRQIVNDLIDAKTLLSTNYSSFGTARPNKLVATAFLSRVYLYEKDWKNAEISASAVITSGNYSLPNDLNSIFLSNSAETIWQLADVNTFLNTAEGNLFIPASSTRSPTYSLNSYLYTSFEAGDLRKQNWLKSITVNGSTYYYPYKYKVRTGTPFTEYNIVLRLAEQYLIRSEARANNNNYSDAKIDLNIIRSRANIPNTSASDLQSLLTAISQERRVEFFAEWGHRWFDLKRTGVIDIILGAEKASNWKSTAALYPLPIHDLKDNIYLTQNPGY